MIADSLAGDIAEGVFDMITTNHLFSVEQVSEEDYIIVWSSATIEQLTARVQERLRG